MPHAANVQFYNFQEASSTVTWAMQWAHAAARAPVRMLFSLGANVHMQPHGVMQREVGPHGPRMRPSAALKHSKRAITQLSWRNKGVQQTPLALRNHSGIFPTIKTSRLRSAAAARSPGLLHSRETSLSYPFHCLQAVWGNRFLGVAVPQPVEQAYTSTPAVGSSGALVVWHRHCRSLQGDGHILTLVAAPVARLSLDAVSDRMMSDDTAAEGLRCV